MILTTNTPQSIQDMPCLSLSKIQCILEGFQDGCLLLSQDDTLLIVNTSLKKQLKLDSLKNVTTLNSLLAHCRLYTQKKGVIQFDFLNWLAQPTPTETQTLWFKAMGNNLAIPIQLKHYNIIDDQDLSHQLIVWHDQSLPIQIDAYKRLMNASYVGQFITNAQGFITQPNDAFCAYTGIPIKAFTQLTYIDWLQQQVALKVPFSQVISSLLSDKKWSGEVKIIVSDDIHFYAILSISMLTDGQNNVEHFMGVIQDITDIRQAQSDIEHLAYYDKLTGLANRTLIHDRIESTLKKARQTSTFAGLYFIDLDGFKIINDTFGHNAGDQLLMQAAKHLTQHISPEDTLARISGDEFMLLKTYSTQNKDTAIDEAQAYANVLTETLDCRYLINEYSIHSSASVGICIFPLSATTEEIRADQLTSYADMAMYEAKKRGGNQSYLFERSLIENAQKSLELIEALNHSEMDDEFQIYFQAQVDQHGKICSAETLLRWFHPHLGRVSPAKFIPVAEKGRQIIKIGLWVMHKAFLQAKAWNKLDQNIRISINISPIQFHEQSFIELVIGLIKFTQVDPKTITLELTEGVLIRNAKLALQKIEHLVSLGFEISIDDFGTGYSSLSYLQKMPIHELKIDQSFIRHIPGNSDDEAIVDSIIALSHAKNLTLVAEGVETQEQSDFLTQRAPKILLQGFYYSRPAPAIDFEQKFIFPTQEQA